jgi:hypothetical protein
MCRESDVKCRKQARQWNECEVTFDVAAEQSVLRSRNSMAEPGNHQIPMKSGIRQCIGTIHEVREAKAAMEWLSVKYTGDSMPKCAGRRLESGSYDAW